MELKVACNCGQNYKFDVEPVSNRMPFAVNCPASRVAKKAPAGEFNLVRGIVGAVLGAAIAAGLMYGFYLLVGFRFPLLGVGIGAATGWTAQKLARGTDSTLGGIAAVVALAATCGSLFLIYGNLPIISLISVAVSASFAYRTAS